MIQFGVGRCVAHAIKAARDNSQEMSGKIKAEFRGHYGRDQRGAGKTLRTLYDDIAACAADVRLVPPVVSEQLSPAAVHVHIVLLRMGGMNALYRGVLYRIEASLR